MLLIAHIVFHGDITNANQSGLLEIKTTQLNSVYYLGPQLISSQQEAIWLKISNQKKYENKESELSSLNSKEKLNEDFLQYLKGYETWNNCFLRT